MNRIGGPSGLPHSRTCSRRPPPPATVWIFIRRSALLASCDRCHLSPPRVRRIDAIVAAEEPERIGRRALSFAARPPYLAVALRAPSSGWRRDTGRMEARASAAFVGRARELAELERALDAAQAGSGRDRPRRRRGGHRQDPARVRARDDAPATPASRSCSGARSISSARSCRTSRSSRRCGRSESSAGRRAARARSCGCSRRRSRCSPSAPPPRPCCSCSRICTGPTRRRSISSSSSPTTSTTGRFCCSRPTARTSSPSAERMRRLADGVRRSGSALVLELGPLAHEELTALLAAHADAPLPAR